MKLNLYFRVFFSCQYVNLYDLVMHNTLIPAVERHLKILRTKHFHLFVSINCFDHNLISHLRSVISNQNCPQTKRQSTRFQLSEFTVQHPSRSTDGKVRPRERPPRPSTSLFPVSSCSSTPSDVDKI